MKDEEKHDVQQKNEERSSFIPTCYQYGNKGNIKPNFPQNHNQRRNQNQNRRKFKKPEKEAKELEMPITWNLKLERIKHLSHNKS